MFTAAIMEFRLPSLLTRIFGETFLAYAWSGACLAGCAIYARAGQPWIAGAFALAAICLALLTTRPVTVKVGAEGISFRWLGLRWFLGYAQIAGIEAHEALSSTRMGVTQRKSTGVLFRRKHGFDVYLVCDPTTSRDLRAAALRGIDALERRTAVVVPELRRSGRALDRWMSDLRSLLGRAEYRAQPRTPEVLWEVLENPKNEADERAAAALALHAHLGNEARPRLRVATDACAEPRLRVALEAIDGGDERRTEAELAILSGPTETRR